MLLMLVTTRPAVAQLVEINHTTHHTAATDSQHTPQSVFDESAPDTLVVPSVPPASIEIPSIPTHDSQDAVGRVLLTDPLVVQPVPVEPIIDDICEKCDDEERPLSFNFLMSQPYNSYRYEQNSLGWLPGSGDDFGWLDWTTDPYLGRGENSGVTGAINIHWLSGPYSVPLPPRLYDLSLGYQLRDTISDRFSYDLFASFGVWTDFEDSARDGVRFPAHAVGMFHVDPSVDIVFGVDYVSRDDISLLPVFGVSLHDLLIDDLRMDLVFPRPRIDYMLDDSHRLYLAGAMEGGTWDIEFPDESNHVMTYVDLRMMLGVESIDDDDGDLHALELGYVFDRRLELRGVPGHMDFSEAFMIRFVSSR